MPTVSVKLYSVLYKLLLRHRLQNLLQSNSDSANNFGVSSRPDEPTAAAIPTFSDASNSGIATKDIHIDPLTSLSIRIFLPSSSILPPIKPTTQPTSRSGTGSDERRLNRRNSYCVTESNGNAENHVRRSSFDPDPETYKGYLPTMMSLNLKGLGKESHNRRKLPVILQFHGGGFVSGSGDSVANDLFCRRIAKMCDAIVIAVGYRLAPETRYPAAFEDGLKVLNWLGKQANLAECGRSMGGGVKTRGGDMRRKEMQHHRRMLDTFGASLVEPWLAAHADLSRFV